MNKPLTSKTLNETMAKKFGTKINVDSFTLEQLQDARNKMRTKQFDIETNESFSGLSQNRTYSKNKLFLDVLNAAISERSDISEAGKPDFLDLDKDGDKKEPMKKAAKDAKKSNKPKKGVKPSFKKGVNPFESIEEAQEKMPSKAHITKMCKDGKTTAEICKMHPDCDQAKLKAMIKDCNSVEETYEGKKENCPECGKKGKVKLMACASCGCK